MATARKGLRVCSRKTCVFGGRKGGVGKLYSF